MLFDQRSEFGSGEMLQQLIEQAGDLYHRSALLERVMEPIRGVRFITTMTGGQLHRNGQGFRKEMVAPCRGLIATYCLLLTSFAP
jgi:hypothetical protein